MIYEVVKYCSSVKRRVRICGRLFISVDFAFLDTVNCRLKIFFKHSRRKIASRWTLCWIHANETLSRHLFRPWQLSCKSFSLSFVLRFLNFTPSFIFVRTQWHFFTKYAIFFKNVQLLLSIENFIKSNNWFGVHFSNCNIF